MTDTLRMDIGQSSEQLVNVQLDFENRHRRFHLVEESRGTIHRLRYKLLHKVQINLIFLRHLLESQPLEPWAKVNSHTLPIGIVKCLQVHNVRVSHDAHDLKFSVLAQLFSS